MAKPSSADIHLKVLRIVAAAIDEKPENLRVYFFLRQKKGSIPGLNMDNTAIEELIPVFNGWLQQYGQKVGTGDVNDSKKVQTISDLGDVIEHRIDAAYAERLDRVWEEVVSWLLKNIGQAGTKVDDDTPLRAPPLDLTDTQVSEFRDELNAELVKYGVQMAITSDEMAAQKLLGDAKKLLGKELETSDVFLE
jgi:hypothetical protein